MNRSYTLIWKATLGGWVVASEHARRHGKGTARSAASRALLASVLLGPAMGFASGNLPAGGSVVSGTGSIGGSDQHMVINQGSHKLAINWQSFDIGSGNSVTFNQPGADSIALNRVLGSDGSRILGNLNANGQVFLINPNGVLFGSGAQVDVGGLVASTLDLSVADFNAGNYRFEGNGTNASVINHGNITAADGGAVALLGGTVRNDGIIVANLGTVALAAGDAITLDFAGDGLLNVQIDAQVKDALVENNQLIQADGGNVILSARAADALLETVVNNTGVIQARTLAEREGKIVLLGDFDGGTVQVAGTLDASAPEGGNGGFIDTSGANVQIAAGTQVTTKANHGTTGTWLIDPTDFTINAGGAAQTDSGIGADTLNANLQNTNVTLQTVAAGAEDGDIHVNAAVTWDADTALTLNAHGDIHINAAITASGENAGLHLNHGGYIQNGSVAVGSDYHVKAPITLSGSNARFSVNGESYTLIRSMADLQAINGDLSGRYALAHSLHSSGTEYDQAVIGSSAQFNGTFTGLGHTVNDLVIDSTAQYVGLFGQTGTSSLIRDVGVVGGRVERSGMGRASVGGLVGHNGGTLSNVYATGAVNGVSIDSSVEVGGLVANNQGSISNAYATGAVNARSTSSWAGGAAGGLVGHNNLTGGVSNAYATGAVTVSTMGGVALGGGLIGYNRGSSTITNVYATGAVSGSSTNRADAGGLVAFMESGSISHAYATGTVTGSSASDWAHVGGLVGTNWGSITNAYATGAVSGSSGNAAFVGGLVGYNAGDVTASSWDIETTGLSDAVGGGSGSGATAINSANRYSHNAYTGFGTWGLVPGTSNVYAASDANGVQWIMIEGQTRPFLASEYSTTIRNAHQLQLMAYDLSAHYTVANNIDASATSGTNLSGMWSIAGFSPVGSATNVFNGTFSGQGHTVNDLAINSTAQRVGLFGQTGTSSVLRDIGLVGGSVTRSGGGDAYVGGLVGYNQGTLTNAYATGAVEGSSTNGNAYVGGLAGWNSSGTITNAYATGAVEGSSTTRDAYVGGLVGLNSGTITNAYATGAVEWAGSAFVGGLVGINSGGNITASFWDTGTSGVSNGVSGSATGITGLTTAQMHQAGTFTGWDIDADGGTGSVWRIYAGHTAPLLRSFLTTVTVQADLSGADKAYDGSTAGGTATYTTELGAGLNPAWLNGTLTYESADALPGTYRSADGTLVFSGLYSGQQGYDIVFAPVQLQITQDTPPSATDAPPAGYTGALASLTPLTHDQHAFDEPEIAELDLEVIGTGIKLPEGLR